MVPRRQIWHVHPLEPFLIAGTGNQLGTQCRRPFDSNSGKKNVMDFEYDSTYRRFNPKQYDPKKWISVARKTA